MTKQIASGNAWGLRTDVPARLRAALNYTFAPNTLYLFDFDVKMDPANGFVMATVSKADGSEAASVT